ncbi:carboxymuconolactone decarboxylase family protein [Burkholderia sp. Bp8963]|nr:carboxymuconolactone decarboxylase family protein [Burkholderia sp. Bp8963]
MLKNWRQFLPKIGQSMKDIKELSPLTIDGYRTLHQAGAETGNLDAKTRELIALAVAVTTRCDGCIANHVKKAIELGVSKAELTEALGVAVAMNAGAALAYSGRVMDAYNDLSEVA